MSLTSEEAVGQALYPSAFVRQESGVSFLAPTLVPGTVAVFDSSGTFTHSLGRYGEGPGEMREVDSVNPWRGDSVAVVHDRNQALIFGTEPAYARSIRFESSSFMIRYLTPLADGNVIAVRFGTGGGEDYPIREFSATGAPGRGYGERMLFGRGRDYAALEVSGDTIWAIRRRSYEIDAFSRVTGHRISSVTRHLDWFPPQPEPNEWGGEPEILDLARAAPGRFWVLIRRPREEFKPQQRRPVSSGPVPASPRRWGVGDEQERFEHVLELIDVSGNVLVARTSLGHQVAQRFMDGDHLYGYAEDPETGSLTVVVWRLSLSTGSERSDP